ncbi:MAG: shikimate kinase [Planctomycetota bacterium]
MARSAPNLVLIGMRASGKTTLGRSLAQQLNRPFLDLDDEVGRLAGCSADELLARDGEAAFRTIELRALATASRLHGHVLATGGGAVLLREAFAALAATGLVIYLQVEAEELTRRAQARPRPPLTDRPPAEEVALLLAEREPLYRAAAQITVSAGGREPILDLVQEVSRREMSWFSGS